MVSFLVRLRIGTGTMCGRYTLHSRLNLLLQQFAIEMNGGIDFGPRYNIAPTQQAPIISVDADSQQRILELRRWGLIPSWAKDAKMGSRMINARAETVAAKPSFRAAFRRRRCLVPADGYYEWKKTPDGKVPFYIQLASQRPLAMAGLYESNRHAGEGYETFTIITTQANRATEALHDRMPVILSPEHYTAWLDPHNESWDALQSLLGPWESEPMKLTQISRRVNNVRNEGPELLATNTKNVE